MNATIRILVGAVFLCLAAAFVGLTALLYDEYAPNNTWFSLAAFDSQLFLFFPLFGVMALIAFYLPACVLLDIYWRHVNGGVWIVVSALAAIVVLAILLSGQLVEAPTAPQRSDTAAKAGGGAPKPLWALKRQSLASDNGERCARNALEYDEAGRLVPGKPAACGRLPFVDALNNMRAVSRDRFAMSVFVRNCRPDPLLPTPEADKEARYCFANNKMQTAAECCAAQRSFARAVNAAVVDQGGVSQTYAWYRFLLPFHIFFLLLVFGLGISLVRRGKMLDLAEYDAVRGGVESRILAGAVLLLFWPLLNHSFLQSADILYGNATKGTFRIIVPVFTIIFAVWTLMLLFFYFRAFPGTVKAVGRTAGIVGSAIAFLKFEEIVGALSRLAGPGADHTTIGIVLLAAIVIIVLAAANRHLLPAVVVEGDGAQASAAGANAPPPEANPPS